MARSFATPRSLPLHESLGFVHTGTIQAWKFDRWLDEGYWELPLPPPA
ncbi:MAG: hypothetical protein OEO77_15880 [Acidimicrobiia bacterium]|nr:hypothetical protein [Acidimicrobiia bacterium]